jgi:hypothetical protein
MLALASIMLPAHLLAAEPDELIANETIKPVFFESLSYPLSARLTRVRGIVVVHVKLDEGGKVKTARAISGPKALVRDCITNALKWRFELNATRSVVIVYDFRIEGLCNHPCSSQFRLEPPNLAVITIGEPVIDHSGKQ